MPRTLILMRHAKSSWSDVDLPDHQRPLNKRGIRSAILLGNWLRDQDILPDQILCSSATRTMQTYQELNLALPAPAVSALYHAPAAAMLDLIHSATGGTVLMIGHNPGIAELAAQLVTSPPSHAKFHDYPTGATLVIDFDANNWTEVSLGTGHSRAFVVPKELPGF